MNKDGSSYLSDLDGNMAKGKRTKFRESSLRFFEYCIEDQLQLPKLAQPGSGKPLASSALALPRSSTSGIPKMLIDVNQPDRPRTDGRHNRLDVETRELALHVARNAGIQTANEMLEGRNDA
tara:strand:+ start:472 stop:837 length:366 start_codon:yes stop_codon:yes gene_type:complete